MGLLVGVMLARQEFERIHLQQIAKLELNAAKDDNNSDTASATAAVSQIQDPSAATTSSTTVVCPKVTCNDDNNNKSDEEEQRSFKDIGLMRGTDKVAGHASLPRCLEDNKTCTRGGCAREECRPWGHFYDSLYQSRLGRYSRNDTAPFQFLEIGYFRGKGFETYMDFFPNAEAHSMEISCIEHGPREEGKWPWDNFAAFNKQWYQTLLDRDRLHCGDANDVDFLLHVWTTKMKRPDAPPLRVVVDDGAHITNQMLQTLFFWFPRIEPGGLLVMEDIQPIPEANKFRTQVLPQLMADLHYCGDKNGINDDPCYPTIQPLLASIHCEMHICVFERNGKPAMELSKEESTMPQEAIDAKTCKALQY